MQEGGSNDKSQICSVSAKQSGENSNGYIEYVKQCLSRAMYLKPTCWLTRANHWAIYSILKVITFLETVLCVCKGVPYLNDNTEVRWQWVKTNSFFSQPGEVKLINSNIFREWEVNSVQQQDPLSTIHKTCGISCLEFLQVMVPGKKKFFQIVCLSSYNSWYGKTISWLFYSPILISGRARQYYAYNPMTIHYSILYIYTIA